MRPLPPALLRAAALHVGVGLEVFFLEDVVRLADAADPARAAGVLVDGAAEGATAALFAAVRGVEGVTVAERRNRGTRLTRRAAAPDAAGSPGPGPGRPLRDSRRAVHQLLGVRGGRHPSRLNLRVPRLRRLQPCITADDHGCKRRSRGTRELNVDEVALAGAADSMLNPLGVGGFGLLRVLSAENDRPEEACRPFDATRQGTVLGEGAAFVVLETLDRACRRRARVYAEVLGYGCSMDAFRVSDPEPSGRGAVLSMAKALADAGLRPDAVDCVNAHGTGTPKNDAVETAAIKEVLGERARRIPVHAVKSMTGHMIAASGAAEAVAAVLTLAERAVPPTINLRTPDPQCDLDYVTDGPRPMTGRTVLSNSFGFGGQNATLIFGRYDA